MTRTIIDFNEPGAGEKHYLGLEDKIRDGIIEARKWDKDNAWHKSKFMVEKVHQYLGCDGSGIVTFEIYYGRPQLNDIDESFLPYLEKNYIDRSAEILAEAGEMDQWDYTTGILRTLSVQKEDLRPSVPKYQSAWGSRRLVRMPDTGLIFVEDDRGKHFIIDIPFDPSFRDRGGIYTFRLIFNREDGGNEAYCNAFTTGLERFSRERTCYRRGAFTLNGAPVRVKPATWSAIKLPYDIMKAVRFHVLDFIDNMEKIHNAGMRTTRGIILAGKPGNGKTLLGRVLASTLDIPVIWVTAKDYTSFGAAQVDKWFEFADYCSPSILFIEDADIFLESRMTGANRNMLAEFLNQIDGIRENRGVLTIITANRPELLDEAVRNRPKRFDAIIEFSDPAPAERSAILGDIIGERIAEGDKAIIEEAAALLEGFTGSHVAEFGERLLLRAVYDNKDYVTRTMVERELKEFGFKTRNNYRAGFRAERKEVEHTVL